MAYIGSLELITAPAVEPVSTAEAKAQARVDISDDDAYINTLVAASRKYIENITGRQIITATWKLHLDSFPNKIVVPLPPLQSVSSIVYIDINGDTQTLASSIYTVNAKKTPGEIVTAYGESWPSTRDVPNAVAVTFVAGYGNAGSDAPADLISAIKLLMSLRYDDRSGEATAPKAVRDLVSNYDMRGYR